MSYYATLCLRKNTSVFSPSLCPYLISADDNLETMDLPGQFWKKLWYHVKLKTREKHWAKTMCFYDSM